MQLTIKYFFRGSYSLNLIIKSKNVIVLLFKKK